MKVECMSFEIELFTDVETILVVEVAFRLGHRNEGREIGIDVVANDSFVITFVPLVENHFTLGITNWKFRDPFLHTVLTNSLGFLHRNIRVVNPSYEFDDFTSNGDRSSSSFLLHGGRLVC